MDLCDQTQPQVFRSFSGVLIRIWLFCGSQCVGDNWPSGRWLVSPANISSAAGSEAGSLPARPAETTGGADEDHGQCGHILHAAHAVHLHFQVCTRTAHKPVKMHTLNLR